MHRISVTALLFLAIGHAQPTYTVTTFAGNNTQGYAGDAGQANAAELNQPFSSVFSGGNLYISDSGNQCIRYVASSGVITTAAGVCGTGSYAGDGGKASAAYLHTPSGVVLDSSGNLYIADNGNNIIRKVTAAGAISLLAGDPNASNFSDGAALSAANFRSPSGIAIDSSGNLYIADSGNNAIRKYTASTATVSTLAGTGPLNAGYSGDGGPAIKATLKAPSSIALDSQGNVYVADTGNHAIRKISGGIITTVAGTVGAGFSGDGGQAIFAHLNNPKGIAFDSTGNLYIADTVNNRIRIVTAAGLINTIAGVTAAGYAGDGGPATSAQFRQPAGVALDASGNIYVSDTGNSVIRLLKPSSQSGTGSLPSINPGGVVSASNFGAFTSIAPGSWIEIYGSNLAAETRLWATTDFNPNAPTSLGRTSVTIANQPAFIDYVSSGQVNAQVPNIQPGTQQMKVTNAVGDSALYTITVNATQPGLYAPPIFTAGGKQYVGAVINDPTTAVQTFAMPPNSVSGFTSRAAHPGETLTIYGIGFGPVDTNTQPGQIAPGNSHITGNIQILFNGTPGGLGYFGLSPQLVGLYQFNVVVPAIPSGNAVPLTFTLNGVAGTQTLYTAVQ
jgi:uncharacterized protein (TIGR03437 family)